ncbi:MAG: ABC transporter ATP-binding protein, partial [Mesorhizobium sp.]
EALSMADRVAVMIGGNLLQLAAPEAIYNDPAHIEVARFVGQPRINIISALAENGRVDFSGIRLALLEKVANGPVSLGIRPEFVKLSPSGRSGLAGRIERLEFLGSEVIAHCRLDASGDVVIAKLAPHEARELIAGMPVGILLSPEQAMVFGPEGRRLRTASAAPARQEPAYV